jgi:hypothetical protein
MSVSVISSDVLTITQPVRKNSSSFSVTFSGLSVVDNSSGDSAWEIAGYFPGATSLNVSLEPRQSTGKRENVRVLHRGNLVRIHRPKTSSFTPGEEYCFSVVVNFELDHLLNLEEYECPNFSLTSIN